jgi:hypothetical protein
MGKGGSYALAYALPCLSSERILGPYVCIAIAWHAYSDGKAQLFTVLKP